MIADSQANWLFPGEGIPQLQFLKELFTRKFQEKICEILICVLAKLHFNSQAPDVPELAHQGILQLSRLSVNCHVETMKKFPLHLNVTQYLRTGLFQNVEQAGFLIQFFMSLRE